MQKLRRSIRLPRYDYSRAGFYFVTICVRNKECLFGEIAEGKVRLSEFGIIADECWREIPIHFNNVILALHVIMPNHIHGILRITNVGARHALPLQARKFGKPVAGSLPTIIGAFKSAVTRRINQVRSTPSAGFWQRNYYEHVIRNPDELSQIRQYISDNHKKWALDRENPDNSIT